MERLPGHLFADEIVVGNVIIPPGRTRPVEVLFQMDPHGDIFEFAASSGQGRGAAIRMHRSEQALLVPTLHH